MHLFQTWLLIEDVFIGYFPQIVIIYNKEV